MAGKVNHADLSKHQCNIVQAQRQFWLDGELCDVVLKSSDGTGHPAHTLVLSAASGYFQNMLRGSFAEADQVRKGEPVEIAASGPVVHALLDYIYGGEPELPAVDDSMELMRLADACGLPDLAAAMEAGLRSAMDKAPVATSLTILKHRQCPNNLKDVCEEKVALNFEACLDEAAFLDLNEDQFDRILRREDLMVSREDIVLKGVFRWFNSAKAIRTSFLNLLLHNVDFQAISSGNLARIEQFASTLGPRGEELQRDVHQAMRAHKKRGLGETPDEFRPKRRCLQHVSQYLGAASSAGGQKVLPKPYWSLRWHGDALYGTSILSPSIYRWRPGEDDAQVVAGRGAPMAGVGSLGGRLSVAVSPDGRIIVADCDNHRLVGFHNGFGQVLVHGIAGLRDVFCSPAGAVYVLNQGGTAVQKLVGDTLQMVIDSENLPAHEKFEAVCFFVTREEVVYLGDRSCKRVLRVKPGDQNAAVVDVVGDVLGNESPAGLFVTEDGKVYVADSGQGKVLAFHPSETTWTEVIKYADQMHPNDVVVHDGSLYVSVCAPRGKGVYKYDLSLPPELELELE